MGEQASVNSPAKASIMELCNVRGTDCPRAASLDREFVSSHVIPPLYRLGLWSA